MRSLPLQMQQNLILAATLLAGVLFAPHSSAPSQKRGLEKWMGGAHAEASYGTAVSLSRRPEILSMHDRPLRIPAGMTRAETSGVRPGAAGGVPTSVVGDWYWSSSNSATNVESSRFTFRSDGHYLYQYAVRQNNRGWAVESTTTEEGTVSFRNDGTFVMSPEQGHFQGNVGDGYVNRRMDEAELGQRTFHWEWRGEKGRQGLYLGPSATSASRYTMAGEPLSSGAKG